jgi:chromosome segregation ATPase
VAQESEAETEAADTLYRAAPDEFMATRTELAKQARADGDAAAATRIEKLRKPTVAAWIVNALVLDDPSTVGRLTELGDRMREAQERLDAAKLRELSTERRRLVDELARAAFTRAKKRQPPAALRDEVTGTFEAAVADPEIAGRLGRLQRSEQWSGFGLLPSGAPQLTVVRGGKQERARPAAPKKSAAERRRAERELAAARSALDEAEGSFAQAEAHERELSQRVKQLTKKLAKLQDELDETRESLEAARRDVSAAKLQRRQARSSLDQAERAARD